MLFLASYCSYVRTSIFGRCLGPPSHCYVATSTGLVVPILHVCCILSRWANKNSSLRCSSRMCGMGCICRMLFSSFMSSNFRIHLSFWRILSRLAYDNTMQTYDVLRILNPDSTFNATKYDEYSPLYLSWASLCACLLVLTLPWCL